MPQMSLRLEHPSGEATLDKAQIHRRLVAPPEISR
jgi:hypothetical protein